MILVHFKLRTSRVLAAVAAQRSKTIVDMDKSSILPTAYVDFVDMFLE